MAPKNLKQKLKGDPPKCMLGMNVTFSARERWKLGGAAEEGAMAEVDTAEEKAGEANCE
ncbi:hypothetical protein TSUD_85340 [Trifolium subterraneum]|uniref:Uncharacterized protein n=1 Tax=Trifolium subterraneum TaxID=3900 RepID=A0A2Z6NRN3_TRISU|nr:hypothetical protein TSUD_85340 [Trifolium subterraneum]